MKADLLTPFRIAPRNTDMIEYGRFRQTFLQSKLPDAAEPEQRTGNIQIRSMNKC